MSSDNQVIIIGGGLAGLTAALHLAEKGMQPVVLEAHPKYPGGRVAGGEYVELNGFRFRSEHGVHGIWSPYRNLQAMLARHEIRPMFVPALEEEWIYKRADRVKRANVGTAIRFSPIPAPLHYLALFFRPSFLRMLEVRDWLSLPFVWGGLVWGLGVDPLAENQPLGNMTLKDVMKWWAPGVRAFMIGLTRNGLAARPEEIPLSGYIAFIRYYTLMRRDSWVFSYMPSDGGTCLVDPIVRKIEAFGGKIILGQQVKEIARHDNQWKVNVIDKSGEEIFYSTNNLIMAADARNTQKILDNSKDVRADVADYYWPLGRQTAVVRVWYDTVPKKGPEGGIFTGDFNIDNYFWLHRLQDEYRAWHKETGGSAIEVHFYGPPEVFDYDDATLLALAISDIQIAFPELRGHRIHSIIQRNTASHTLFGVGPEDKHLGIDTPWENLYACGDWVRDPVPALFLERAAATGILAANRILNNRGLPAWPLLDYPKPEPLAAFIQKLMRFGRSQRRK